LAGTPGRKDVKTKTPFEDKLLATIEPIAADLGFEVVRLRVVGGARRKRLQVMAERPDGSMTIDDCAALSRAISAALDVADPFAGEWDLESSSPGIDRPLTALEHFERWAGHEAKIELDRLLEGRKRYSGALAGVQAANVLLDAHNGEGPVPLPFAWIVDAKLVLTDALVAQSLKRRDLESEQESLEVPEDPETSESSETKEPSETARDRN
jgi:ribosome maturation factor RimP